MISHHTIDCAGRWLARFSLGIAALLILAIMGVTVVEVIGRYFLSAPIHGKGDLIKLMLGAALFFAMPVVTLQREHICVDLLDGMTGSRLASIRDFVVDLVVGGLMLVMAYWVGLRAEKFLHRGEVTELLFIPKYPLAYFIAAALCLTGGLLLITAIMRLRRKKG